ncbi:MAG: EVE domain-containing protein [Bacteroidetes bacterium]|nr:EVE domain-containing protein [Bacteroidota bacterium]
MKYWLLKTEPNTFSWQELKERKSEPWDGVRNYQARNYLREISVGDFCFIYHSGEEKQIVGLAKCVKSNYPDPTAPGESWVCIDLAFEKDLRKALTLAELKADPFFIDLPLIKHTRLSVMPVPEYIFERIMELVG